MHEAIVKSQAEHKLNKEIEKTKRHKMSEDVNLLMFKELKFRVKQLIGEDEYLKLIHECRDKIEGKDNG